jgi:hypothetical protein
MVEIDILGVAAIATLEVCGLCSKHVLYMCRCAEGIC